jgi:membrane protein implicated in regulation of membrane protease activity
MMEWWKALSTINQVFYAVAAFFSVLFLWQFISSLIGLAGSDVDADIDADVDADIDGDVDVDVDDIEAHSIEDAAESTMAFRIFSVRAILAFFTLFFWAGAMYLDAGKPLTNTLILALAWGLAAWVFVAVLIHWLRKLAETGTQQLSTCVGKRGSVYLDIPAEGQGEVRVIVSGVISMVKARAAGGNEIKAGTPVQVVRMLDGSSVEVQPVEPKAKENGKED